MLPRLCRRVKFSGHLLGSVLRVHGHEDTLNAKCCIVWFCLGSDDTIRAATVHIVVWCYECRAIEWLQFARLWQDALGAGSTAVDITFGQLAWQWLLARIVRRVASARAYASLEVSGTFKASRDIIDKRREGFWPRILAAAVQVCYQLLSKWVWKQFLAAWIRRKKNA